MEKNRFSKYAIILCALIAMNYMYTSKLWVKEGRVIGSDVIDYYGYLPATFIFHDLGLKNPNTIKNGIFYVRHLSNGNVIFKMSMGMSILYSPAFFAGHAVALITGEKANGFSTPYRAALLIGALVYFVLGLIFLRKILFKFFNDRVTMFTILAVTVGTNLIYYASFEAAMSHMYNFSLFSFFIYHTLRWHDKKTLKRLIGLGFLGGLITLIRPTNIIVLLFFFLYDIQGKENFKMKFHFILKKFHWFIFMALAFIAVWIPQFLYYHHFTGKFLFYSYTEERFFFNNPQIINGLFSYRKGWFLYTPMMLIAVLSISLLFVKQKKFSFAILIFTIVNVYIVFSWYNWWYGGSFSQRPMVDSYGLLAIPLAVFINEAWNFKKWSRILSVSIISLLIVFNIFQVEKYKRGAIHYADMTKAAYWHSFWSIRPKPGFYDLLETPDYNMAVKGIYVTKKKEEKE